MTLKIQRIREKHGTRICLSGELRCSHLLDLRAEIEQVSPAARILPGLWKSLPGAACSAGESEERSPATSPAPGLTGGRGFGQNPLHAWHKVWKSLSLSCRSGRTKTAQQIGQSIPVWLPRGRAPGGGSAGNHLGIADDRSWVQMPSPLSLQVVAALREADAG